MTNERNTDGLRMVSVKHWLISVGDEEPYCAPSATDATMEMVDQLTAAREKFIAALDGPVTIARERGIQRIISRYTEAIDYMHNVGVGDDMFTFTDHPSPDDVSEIVFLVVVGECYDCPTWGPVYRA